jgi:hypothetical protein
MRMGVAKPRSRGPGGELDVQRSEIDIESDAAGSITGNAATFAVVTRRQCPASEEAPTAATTPL